MLYTIGIWLKNLIRKKITKHKLKKKKLKLKLKLMLIIKLVLSIVNEENTKGRCKHISMLSYNMSELKIG